MAGLSGTVFRRAPWPPALCFAQYQLSVPPLTEEVLLVDIGITGFKSHLGMASVFVLLNKDDMQYDRSLRKLWYNVQDANP